MTTINRDDYSLFSCFDSNKKSDCKKIKVILDEVISIISEVYNITYDANMQIGLFDMQEINEFLIALGIISDISECDQLQKIAGKDYDRYICILSKYLKREEQVIEPLQQYMDKYRKQKVEDYLSSTQLTVVDFFCGAGGMSLGFTQNGFKTLLANDIETVCTDTYSLNHPEVPRSRIVTGDIKQVVNNIGTKVTERVDVIIGGPPCQGFSNANRQRIIDDPRNVLYKYYVEAIKQLQPKMVVMENVKGMLSVAEQVQQDFSDINYEVAFRVFNAKDFGVPQNRERLIYIGIRKDLLSNTVNPSEIIEEIQRNNDEEEKFTLIDAIGDLPKLEALKEKNATELETKESGKKIMYNPLQVGNTYLKLINREDWNVPILFNHKARYNNDRDIEIFSRMLPGDKSDSERIADIMPYTSRSHMFKDKYFKLLPNEVSKTITAHMKFDCNMYIHPNQARGLTPREAARVQSYPDNYFFTGAYTKTYMQIGNSVPPLMARGIAKVVKGKLKEGA